MLYQWVVTPDEFMNGQEHAVPLDEIISRAKRAMDLGVIRRLVRGVPLLDPSSASGFAEKGFAVEFAPVTKVKSIHIQGDMPDREGYSTMRLEWKNRTFPEKGSYTNTEPLTINRKGLFFNDDTRRYNLRRGVSVDLENLDPRLATGYLIDREYAYAAGGVLPVATAIKYITLAREHQIFIPKPGFVEI